MTDDLAKFSREFQKDVLQDIEGMLAEELAKAARENGMTDASEVDLDIDSPEIDREAVVRRANEIIRRG